jgi:alpha-galactosidase
MSVSTSETRWSIETPDLTIVWELGPGGELLLASLRTAGTAGAAGREWIATPAPVFTHAGDPATGIAFRDISGEIDDDRLRLSGTIGELAVTLDWTVHVDASVVVGQIAVTNRTDGALELASLSSLRLAIPRTGRGKLSVLAGGRWDPSMPPRGYRLQQFDVATPDRSWFGAAEDGRSSGEYVPWFALTDPGDGGSARESGFLAALDWTGRWRLDTRRTGNEIAIGFGISEFAHILAPGESMTLPGVVLAGFVGDLDAGADRWRTWLTGNWMPATPENWPGVQYNHWYAYFGDIDENRLFDEAKYAAAAGAEVFVIDDGWFEGRRPDSYFAGIGNWHEDPAKFPRGLHAFGDRVRDELGMKFGLWVEPERSDHTGQIVRDRPDWVAMRNGAPIYRRHGSEPLEGMHLCLGNPDVQRWMIDDLIRVVREYGVDWLKWDYNLGYGLGCDASDHGHQPTDGHYAHTLGLYRVLTELRAACPELVIENCASGGHRVDLGMLRHTHTNWISDYTYRAASCRQHVQGAGLFLPLVHLNTWVLAERDTFEFRSRFGGAFGFSDFMEKWTPDERTALAVAIAEYKRLRPFLQAGGERALLTGPWHQDWEVWQFTHPNGDDVALLAFREAGQIGEVRIRLPGVKRDRAYRLHHEGGAESEAIAGSDLVDAGFTIELPEPRSSALIWLSPV